MRKIFMGFAAFMFLIGLGLSYTSLDSFGLPVRAASVFVLIVGFILKGD